MAPRLGLTHKSAQSLILLLFLCIATSYESSQEQQQQLRVFGFPPSRPGAMGWLVLIVTAWAACGTSSGGFLVWGGGWLGVLGPGGLVLEGVVLSEGVSGLCLWEVNGTTPNG